MRIGTNKRPFYRVVAVDERKKRTGGYLELLGTYNPLTEPKEINLDQAKIDAWLKKGAQPSDGFLRIIGKAKQRLPRPAKKQKKESSVISPQTSDEEQKPVEEATVSETTEQAQPAEEVQETEAVTPEEAKSEEGVHQAAEESATEEPAADSTEQPAEETAEEDK